MKIRHYILAFIALGLTVGTGCKKEVDSSVLELQEKRYFDLYIAANYSDIEPTASGLYYLDFQEGTGESPDSGDYVLINYVAYTVPNEDVVDTYSEDWAREHNLYTSGVLYGPYKFMHGSEIPGLKEGLSMMKEGGIARLLFTSKLGYGSVGFSTRVSAYESLMYDVQLLEVIDDASAKEFNQIQACLDTIGPYETIYDEVEDAYMYYIPGVVGEGDAIAVDDEVEIFYTGQLLDGRIFDSNVGKTTGLKVTIGDESVIRGWEVGLPYFNYGGTGKLLIPHPLAYGETGNFPTNSLKYSIPPIEALLFDIEVVAKDTTTTK